MLHVVQDEFSASELDKFSRAKHLLRTRYALAAVCVLMAFAIRSLVGPVLGHHHGFIIFVLAAFVAGWYGGLGPGLAALLAGLVLGELFQLPLFRLAQMPNRSDLALMVIYFCTAFVGLAMVSNLHRTRNRVRRIGTHAGNLQREVRVRVQAEEALRHEKAKLDLALKAAHLCIWELDFHHGQFELFCSYEPILGPGQGHYHGNFKELLRLVHFRDRRRLTRLVVASIRDGRDREAEFRLVWADGTVHWILAKWKLTGHMDSIAHRIQGVMMEITARKQAEQALRESEERARAEFKGFPVPTYIWQKEPHGQFVLMDYNEASSRFTQGHIVEFVGVTAREMFHDEPQIIQEISRTFDQKTCIHREMKYRLRSTGEVKELSTTYVYVPPDMVMINTEDITERKAAEHALRESEERAKAQFRGFPIPTFTFQKQPDGEFTMVYFNTAADRITEGKARDLLGKTAHDLFSHQPEVTAEIIRCFEGKSNIHQEIVYHFRTTGEVRNLSATYVYVPPDLVMIHTEDITERKKAEQALRESEERAKAQYQGFPIPTSTYQRRANGEFVLVDYNQAGNRITGGKAGELLGKTARDLFSHQPEVAAEIIRCFGEKTSIHHEISYYFKTTGETRELSATFVYVPPDLVMVHTEDITERKRAQEALQRALALYSTILESTEDGILVVDLNGNVVSCNRQFGVMWNIPADLLASKDDMRLLAYARTQLAEPEGFLRKVRELMAQPEAESRDEVVFKNGRVLERFSQPHRVGGKTVGRVWSFHDVTARKQTEEALRQSEINLRELADAMPQIIWTTRPDGQPDYYNQRWFDYSGQTRDEVMTPHGLQAILHPDDLAFAAPHWAHCLATGETFEIQGRYRHREGNYRWFLIRAVPIKDELGRISKWFGTSTDIEDQKRTEQDLQAAREQLLHYAHDLESRVAERTGKLEETVRSLEGVLYHVAHDLRAPLRSLSGFTQLLIESLGPDAKQEEKDSAERIVAAAQRMDRLILDLLTYGRLGHSPLSIKEVDLTKEVEAVLRKMNTRINAAQGRVEIVFPLPQVMADTSVLEQVLVQLLDNALTFVAPGVLPRIRILSERRDGKKRLWIEDNGIGIEKAYWQRIFRVFERLQAGEQFTGTGIGLAIVAKGMERMGGCAGVESEPGRGSRFWIDFP